MHILQKIISYIRGSGFSLFDISSWNPNVTLELGIALALSEKWYIFNPSKTELEEVPSDIRGIDRIQYTTLSDLEDKLTALLEQWYPKGPVRTVDEYMGNMEANVRGLLSKQPGLKVVDIAEIFSMNKKMVQVIVRQLLDSGELRLEGQTRGARYFPTQQRSQPHVKSN
jgi:hypothetical protein